MLTAYSIVWGTVAARVGWSSGESCLRGVCVVAVWFTAHMHPSIIVRGIDGAHGS